MIGLSALGSKEIKAHGTHTIDETEIQKWMAPDQLTGDMEEATEATLAYAVRMVMFHIVRYRIPFHAMDPQQLLRSGKDSRPASSSSRKISVSM